LIYKKEPQNLHQPVGLEKQKVVQTYLDGFGGIVQPLQYVQNFLSRKKEDTCIRSNIGLSHIVKLPVYRLFRILSSFLVVR